jgi:transcriptional regulator with XRE-family HTH domain
MMTAEKAKGVMTMTEKTMAEVISSRRKELGMTQKDLAEKLNITDKAVSKWERGIACPDTAAIPKLAQILGISLEELMTTEPVQKPGGEKAEQVLDVALKAIPLAMGIAVTVLSFLGEMDLQSGFSMLGIGIACLAIRELKK